MDNSKYLELKDVNFDNYKDVLLKEIRKKSHDNIYIKSIFISTLVAVMEINEIDNLDKLYSYIMDEDIERTTKEYLLRNIEKSDEEINSLVGKFSIDEKRAYILHSNDLTYSKIHENTTPEGISKLAIRLLDINKDDTLINLCSGQGKFLINASIETNPKKMVGYEINEENFIVSNLRNYILDKKIEIVDKDCLMSKRNELFDKVFCNFPLNEKFMDVYSEYSSLDHDIFAEANRNISSDWIYTLNALDHMKDGGKTLVIMTNSGLSNSSDYDLRKHLLENKRIEAIISLPENLLSMANMDINLVLLSQDNETIRMVDASEIYTKGRRINRLTEEDVENILFNYENDTSLSMDLSPEDLDEHWILLPKYYLDKKLVEYDLRFEDIILDVKRGSPLKSSEIDKLITEEENKNKYLMIQNINDGFIDDKLPNISKINEDNKRFILEKDDIILSKNGNPFKVAINSHHRGQNILANGNLYIIKINKDLANPYFIKAYLESKTGQKNLERLAKGAKIKNISIRDLKKLVVPSINIAKQDEFEKEYKKICNNILKAKKDLSNKMDLKNNIVESYL